MIGEAEVSTGVLRIESLECVLFGASLDVLDQLALWTATFGGEPEESSTQRDGPRMARSRTDDCLLQLIQHSGRVDLQVQPLPKPESKFPLQWFIDAEAIWNRFSAWSRLLLAQCRGVTRIGIHAASSGVFDNREACLAVAKRKLSFLPLEERSRDFIFQLNNGATFRTGSINCIVNWSAADFQSIKLDMSSPSSVPTIVTTPGLRCAIDFNNAVNSFTSPVMELGAAEASDLQNELLKLAWVEMMEVLK